MNETVKHIYELQIQLCKKLIAEASKNNGRVTSIPAKELVELLRDPMK